MAEYKYPYVHKEYFPAVMFACKLIREYGTFNRAVETSADYYGVDKEILASHVRKRQSAGQKGESRKYYWFKVYGYQDYIADDDCGTHNSWSYREDDFISERVVKVVKATSEKNAITAFHNSCNETRDYFVTPVVVKQFNTHEEAENCRITKDEFLDGIGREHIHD